MRQEWLVGCFCFRVSHVKLQSRCQPGLLPFEGSLELEDPLLIWTTRMADSRRPQFLIICSRACLSTFPEWWLASPAWVSKGEQDEATMSFLTWPRNSHTIIFTISYWLLGLALGSVGADYTELRPPGGQDYCAPSWRRLPHKVFQIYQQTVILSICRWVFKSLLYLQLSLLLS